MVRPRFTVADALKGILVLGLALAALRGESPIWGLATSLAALGALLAAILGLIYLRGKGRAFAGGFALFGWAFLLLSTSSSGDRLFIQSGMQDYAYDAYLMLHDLPPPRRYPPTTEVLSFRCVLFSELNLLFALVGGYTARAFAARAVSKADDRGEARREP
jgi:hypothetical protein